MNNPTTYEEAIKYLEDMDMKDRKSWLDKDEQTAGGVAHHGFGTYLRNTLKLWVPETPLVQHFVKTFEIYHADDISGVIIGGYHRKMNGKDWGHDWIKGEAKRYKKHWEEVGIVGIPEQYNI